MDAAERKMVSEALKVKIKRVEKSRGRVSFVTESIEMQPDPVEFESVLSAHRSAGIGRLISRA